MINMKNKKAKKETECKTMKKSLFLLMFMLSAIYALGSGTDGVNELTQTGESRVVTGTVTDTNGEALIGVSIIVKGTSTGVLTNLDGAYSIQVPDNNAVLVFSYVGFTPQEVKAGTQRTINITLREDVKLLDEVVVIGYGVQKKKLVTGATVQVGGDDIQKLSTNSVLGALQSQTPGVNIVQSSGMPGEGFKVVIRGLGTIGTYAPLYVIDGVSGGDINNLNPSDIESVDVLKDAASAAIYGSRGANGIILVTTKKAKTGKMQVSYDGYVGWQNAYKMPSSLNAKEYMTIVNEARRNDGTALYDYAKEIPAQYQSIMDGTWKGTNWLEEIRVKNAVTQNHAINIIGGSETSSVSLGFSYANQEGIFGKPVAPQYQRYNFRLNSEHIILKGKGFDIIKVGEHITFTQKENKGIGIGNRYWNDINNMLKASPLMPLYNSKGQYYDQPSKEADGWALSGSQANPIADMVYERGQNVNKNFSLRANVYVEIQPIKDLKWRSMFSYDNSSGSYRSYIPVYNLSTTVQNTTDKISQSAHSGYGWGWENLLTYNFTLAGKHNFETLLGQSMSKWGFGDNVGGTNSNYLFPGSFEHAYLNNTKGVSELYTSVTGSPWGKGAVVSFFGRINYNMSEKYMASVSLRADGSHKFARGHRWGYFPAVSAGWVVSNEAFMESSKDWMDFLKLRASWGQNGNSEVASFQYLATIAFDNNNAGYYFGNKQTLSVGGYPDILPNSELTWETSEQINIGLDSYFLNNRLGFIFDWYKKTTRDWLVKPPVLASYGTGAPYINGGEIINKGVEVALNWNDRIQDFRYGAGINLAYNKNEVTEIANEEGIIRGETNLLSHDTPEIHRAQVGFPVGYFWGYKTAGVFQNLQQIADTPVKLDGAQPGDLIFVDDNKDGVIDEKDKTMIGNPHPDVTIGFNLNLAYKGFDISASATGAFGHQIMKSYRSFVDSPLNNYTTEIFGRWHGEGTSNKLPRLTNGGHTNWKYISDIYVEDADYVRLQNITFGYDFKRLFPRIPLSKARVYVAVNNLFTITGYSGMDPENGYGGSESWAAGTDLGFYPSPRTFLIGVNLNF